MISSQLVVEVGEEEQLGVGVNGDVSLDDGLVLADEVSHILDLDFRLGLGTTVCFTAGVSRGSHGCGHREEAE